MDEARLRKALARFDEMENYLLMKDLRRSMRDYATPDVALFIRALEVQDAIKQIMHDVQHDRMFEALKRREGVGVFGRTRKRGPSWTRGRD